MSSQKLHSAPLTTIHNITVYPQNVQTSCVTMSMQTPAASAAAWGLKPPWQQCALTPPSPSPSSSPSSPHHQADLLPSSPPRPWHSRLPLPAPGTPPTCQPPDSAEDEWIAEKTLRGTTDGSHLAWSPTIRQLANGMWWMGQWGTVKRWSFYIQSKGLHALEYKYQS